MGGDQEMEQGVGTLGRVDAAEAGTLEPVELLAVADSGLLLLYQRRIGLVRFRAIDAAVFPLAAARPVLGGAPPDDSTRARLRRMARFPEGLAATRLDSVLAAYGQPALQLWSR